MDPASAIEARSSRTVAVVPAFNEEETVGHTVRALRDLPGLSELVVIADGSTDGTEEVARSAGAIVLRSAKRLGKGRALELALAMLPTADIYLFVDADVGPTASQVAKLLDTVKEGEADLAVAALPRAVGGGFGLVKRVAKWGVRALTGRQLGEPLSGQRAIILQALDACRPLADRFGVETAMSIDALRLGFRVVEVPVDMTHRPTGRGPRGFVHRGRQGWDILRAVLPRAVGVR